jgi:hypothetical protein
MRPWSSNTNGVDRARRAADRVIDAFRVGGAGGLQDVEDWGLLLFTTVEDLVDLLGAVRREYPGEYPTPSEN